MASYCAARLQQPGPEVEFAACSIPRGFLVSRWIFLQLHEIEEIDRSADCFAADC
jgi:hypothetical protein